MSLDLLIVGSHPDDAELGAGGLLALAADAGLSTGIAILTAGEGGAMGTAKERIEEAREGASILNVREFHILDLPDTKIEPNLIYAEELESLIVKLSPKTIISHTKEDWNPDHYFTWTLVERAWALANRYSRHGSDLVPRPRLLQFPVDIRRAQRPDIVIDVSSFWEIKENALRAHRSQTEIIENAIYLGRFYGAMIGVEYGEPFYLPEPLGVSSKLNLF